MRPISYPLLVAAALLGLAAPQRAAADALVRTQAMKATTIAEFFIDDGFVALELEIGERDLKGFANVLPDEAYAELGLGERPLAERLPEFFRNELVIREPEGEPIIGKIVSSESGVRVLRDDVTGDPLPPAEGEEPAPVWRLRLEYPLPERPPVLTLKPPLDAEDGGPTVSIGFVAYHHGVAINDFRYLGKEEILDLDWGDAWYSGFRNRNLKRQFSAPAQGYIYVENFEVRKEILIRPRDLQRWIDLGIEGKEVIAAADQEALKEKAAEFLAGRCPTTVDGLPAEFEFERVHFLKRTLRQTTVLEEPVDLPAASAMLGAIFVHRRDGLPKRAALTWDLFDDKITAMSGATHDEAGPLPWTVTPEDPVLEWKNYLKNPTLPSYVKIAAPPVPARWNIPVLSAVCALLALVALFAALRRQGEGRRRVPIVAGVLVVAAVALSPLARVSLRKPFSKPATVDGGEAQELITGLLRNVYRAFDYRDEDSIYDGLARSVEGDLLTEIYVQVYQALVMQSQGGAKIKVDQLEMLDCEKTDLEDGAGFGVRCRWNVGGKVNHWGHVHRRTNAYEAEFTVRPVDGRWKITGQKFLGTRRVG